MELETYKKYKYKLLKRWRGVKDLIDKLLLIQVCQKMLDTPELRGRIQQQETEKFIIRVMVALIILYDHIHPTGAFAKGIDVIVLSQLGHEIKSLTFYL